MTDKFEALKAKKPADTKSLKAQAAGYVTDDNSGGYYVVECQECGEVYPSQECDGGGPIADSGDYNDALCPHCGCESPDECNDTPLVWNVQQAKINALLAALEALKAKTSTTMGVGNGCGNLFVYGDYDSIKAAQLIVLENEKLRAALEEREQQRQQWYDSAAEICEKLKAAEQRLQQPIPALGSVEVNDAAWKLHDMLTEYGPLNGYQFNNLKGCFYEALKTCFKVEGK